MTPEQKRIIALEDTILDLVAAMDEARMGFGTRYANRIRVRIRQNRETIRFTAPAKKPAPAPEPTTPAAPEEAPPA